MHNFIYRIMTSTESVNALMMSIVMTVMITDNLCHSSFSALMLLIGRLKGHPACKISATAIPKSLFLETGLTQNTFRKVGCLNKNRVCVIYLHNTPWVKKGRHHTLVHIFTKYSPISFFGTFCRKFAIKLLLKISTRLKHVTTLPCEILMSEN